MNTVRTRGRRPIPLAERFWPKVDAAGPCWEWTGALIKGGYGTIRRAGAGSPMDCAHRVAYELLVGPIPEGLHLDHLCRNRRCVNPDHLEPVTCAENLRRGVSFSAINGAKTACVNGHPFTKANTYLTREGWRQCRTCRSARDAAARARKRAAA